MGEGKVNKIFAIGDIHGCLSHLERLMEEIRPLLNPQEDVLVFMGDYVDRGPNSKGVVDFILQMQGEISEVVCLKGNHEDMFLDWVLNGRNYDLYLYNGGGSTIRSYSQEGSFEVPPAHLDFFTSLRLYYETDRYIFVHAGLRAGIPLEKQDPYEMVWIREEFIYSPHDFGKLVIFGHTPLHKVFVAPNKIGIDTGAVYGGKLTCLELPAQRFYSV
ncbi:MAG: serine/threonine protein phosphatase [Deltaproteobacteria bacterium]|nr:MAG: serine/threonine protein phosphatase [Deltaproteobacteria bacterium]